MQVYLDKKSDKYSFELPEKAKKKQVFVNDGVSPASLYRVATQISGR